MEPTVRTWEDVWAGTGPFRREEFAGPARRLVALALDTLFYVGSLLAAVTLVALANGGSLSLDEEMFLLLFGWSLIWETLWVSAPTRGKPGQRIAGFRVARLDGSRVSLRRAALRWAARVAAWPTIGFLAVVSAVLIARTGRRQGFHDLVASTVCVRPAALERLASPQFAGMAGSEAVPAAREPSAGRHRGPFL